MENIIFLKFDDRYKLRRRVNLLVHSGSFMSCSVSPRKQDAKCRRRIYAFFLSLKACLLLVRKKRNWLAFNQHTSVFDTMQRHEKPQSHCK